MFGSFDGGGLPFCIFGLCSIERNFGFSSVGLYGMNALDSDFGCLANNALNELSLGESLSEGNGVRRRLDFRRFPNSQNGAAFVGFMKGGVPFAPVAIECCYWIADAGSVC